MSNIKQGLCQTEANTTFFNVGTHLDAALTIYQMYQHLLDVSTFIRCINIYQMYPHLLDVSTFNEQLMFHPLLISLVFFDFGEGSWHTVLLIQCKLCSYDYLLSHVIANNAGTGQLKWQSARFVNSAFTLQWGPAFDSAPGFFQTRKSY